jgi:PAS domain S-box-containing protein
VITAVRARQASVLVVEDNKDLCENMAEILSGEGYRVATALSARAAAEIAREEAPDVALVDLNLPDGSGMDLVAALGESSPETACVILTGNASIESAIDAVNRGAYAYLLKGGRIEEVLATVERAAEKVRLEAEKRRLERALREERNFSRAVVSNAALGIVVATPQGIVIEANRRMRDLLGPGAPEPRDARDLANLGRDEAARARLWAALFGERAEPVEVEIVRADGARRIWTVSTSAVEGEGGRREATVAIFTDVTEERELQRKVVEASRLAAIGEMAARVAHEIRNPLAGIAGAIRVLGRGIEGDAKKESFLRELLALVGRLNSFVEDLLLYARPLRVNKEETSLAAVLEPLRAVLKEHPATRGVLIEVDDRLGRGLFADRHFFGMAIQNLVLNAAQAAKGKGRVRIAAERAEEGGALVTVCDDGPGIPSDVLPVLFDAFATARIEGTGLGLSTTKRIVEAHGGTISASNRPEGGARFEIRLPG